MRKIAFQGEPGAFGHAAVEAAYPADEAVPCVTFEETIQAVASGGADLGMVPIENSLYGRVTDIHHLLPESGLFIVGEHYQRVRLNLLAVSGASLADIATVESHPVALGQCRKYIQRRGFRTVSAVDTAGSAREVAGRGDKTVAAIASKLAGKIHALDVLDADIEDEDHNTTRFLVMAREQADVLQGPGVKTTFVFRVRNVPAALYKALGGFATNSVNMTKLESYMLGGSFNATQFYADIEGHPDDVGVRHAMEELDFFTDYLRILGVYKAAKVPEGEG